MGSWSWSLARHHICRDTGLIWRCGLRRRHIWCSSCRGRRLLWCACHLSLLLAHWLTRLSLCLEAFLLFLEFSQEVTTFPEKLLGRELSVLELLHFFLRHVALSLSLRELLAQVCDSSPADLLLLKRDTISKPSLGDPVLDLLLGHVRREVKVQRADLCLDLREQLGEVLRVVGLGTLDRLTLLGLALLLLRRGGGLSLMLLERLLSVLLEHPHALHQVLR